MIMRLFASLLLAGVPAFASAAVTVDGVLTAGETYLNATNSAAGVDTNAAHYSGGSDAKSERIRVPSNRRG
jgi:predicted porin